MYGATKMHPNSLQLVHSVRTNFYSSLSQSAPKTALDSLICKHQ
jgi:hypothetical protein